MLSRLTRYLDKRTNFILLLFAVCSSIGGGMAYREFSYLLTDRYPSPVEEQRRFAAQIEIDGRVDDELAVALREVAADRVIIWRAHNGQQDISGLPFAFLSVTYTHVRGGVNWEEAWSRPISMSTLGTLLRSMWRNPAAPVCVKRAFAEATPMAQARLRSRGVELAYVCPIVTERGGPVGLISVEYLRDESQRPSDAVILARLSETSRTVYRHLATINDR